MHIINSFHNVIVQIFVLLCKILKHVCHLRNAKFKLFNVLAAPYLPELQQGKHLQLLQPSTLQHRAREKNGDRYANADKWQWRVRIHLIQKYKRYCKIEQHHRRSI